MHMHMLLPNKSYLQNVKGTLHSKLTENQSKIINIVFSTDEQMPGIGMREILYINYCGYCSQFKA